MDNQAKGQTVQTIADVKKGDVVRFDTFALRVEKEPEIKGNQIVLSGRVSKDGCPSVRRAYFSNLPCKIERN